MTLFLSSKEDFVGDTHLVSLPWLHYWLRIRPRAVGHTPKFGYSNRPTTVFCSVPVVLLVHPVLFPSLGVDDASIVGCCCLAWVISASCLVFFVFQIPACDLYVAELDDVHNPTCTKPDSQPVSQHPTKKASLPEVGSYFGSFPHEMCYQLATSGKPSSSAPLSDPDRR